MLAGASESCLSPIGMVGFERARALAPSSDPPAPFDINRNGFGLAEGAAVLVLESEEHVRKRKPGKIYAEIVGYGASCDAYHIARPHPEGLGAIRSMKSALGHANMQPHMIDYISAHATGTPVGDDVENYALVKIFGNRSSLTVSSCKGATGHSLGAAGAIEAAFTALSIYYQIRPPTANLKNPGPPAGIESLENYIFNYGLETENKKTIAALSNSFGFGGVNASLIFKMV